MKIYGLSGYNGGKSGNGTYQTIINHIPPTDVYYSLYLGRCGVTRHIRPAKRMILNDIDPNIVQKWRASNLPDNYELHNENALDILRSITAESCGMISLRKPFIYLDPPYRKESRKSKRDIYRFESSEQHHVDLLSQITAMLQFNICVSHYDDPLYNEALTGWHTHEYPAMTRNGMVTEKIYFNYEIGDELHDYSFIGDEYREREALARIKRNVVKKFATMPPRLRNSILQVLTAEKCDDTGTGIYRTNLR